MSSFFPAPSYKPHVRQEGFHLPSPTPSTTTPPPNSASSFESNTLFIPHNFLPDAFRKFPSQADGQPNSMDFTDELASLMANPPSATHHERSTHSPPLPPTATGIQNAANVHPNTPQFDDAYRSSHNLFDVSTQNRHPPQHHPHSSTSSTSSGFQSHFSLPGTSHRPSEVPLSQAQPSQSHIHTHHQTHSLHEFTSPAQHFNSAHPAIGSAIRYEHHLDPPPPPSSFPSHFRNSTPSPIGSRSRSRSRAPSVPPPPSVVGPTRTTRSRRNNSLSSTSPPPHPAARPQAIVIPSSHRPANGTTGLNGHGQQMSPLSLHNMGGNTNPWYIPSHGTHSSEYSLPTPESLTHSHHSHSLSQPNFTPFGLSPSETHLPPVSTLHSHSLSKHDDHIALSHSRSNSGTTPHGSIAGNGINPGATGSTVTDKQTLLANEKRRRRRESHNAVERRRRDNINEKISELATLIPECMLDPTCPPGQGNALPTDDPLLMGVTETKKEDNEANEAGVVKANKGMILRKSVEYIRYLQQLVNAQATRNRDLEQQLSAYRSSSSPDKPLSSSSGAPPAQTHTPTSNSPASVAGDERQHDVGKGEDDMGLMLHEEVVAEEFGVSGFGLSGMGMGFGVGGGFGKGMFELPTMPEGGAAEMEVEDGEGRPGTGGSIRMSPSTGSAEGSEPREEEERGRRGRDGRVRGVDDGLGMGMGAAEKMEV